MFCKNCGSEIDNNAKFCNNCGAPQEVAPVAAPVYEDPVQPTPQPTVPTYETSAQPTVAPAPQQTPPQYNSSVPYNPNGNLQPPVQAKKSSKGCIVAILVVVALFALIIVGSIIFAVVGFSDSSTSDDSSYSSDISVITDTPNAEYTAIFTDHNIVEAPAVFIGLDSRAFAIVDEDGMIEKMEFGYDGDKIKELVDTIYYPISGLTEDVISALDDTFRETFAPAEELDCCTVTYEQTADYYIITVHSIDLNNIVNLTELSDVGVVTYDGFATYLSIDVTADNLISQGYVER